MNEGEKTRLPLSGTIETGREMNPQEQMIRKIAVQRALVIRWAKVREDVVSEEEIAKYEQETPQNKRSKSLSTREHLAYFKWAEQYAGRFDALITQQPQLLNPEVPVDEYADSLTEADFEKFEKLLYADDSAN